MRLIDADIAEKIMSERYTELAKEYGHYDHYTTGYGDALSVIEEAPTIEAEPVRHGRWEFLGPNRLIGDCMCGTCSVCKVRCKYIVNKNICPNCGAKMDGNWKQTT